MNVKNNDLVNVFMQKSTSKHRQIWAKISPKNGVMKNPETVNHVTKSTFFDPTIKKLGYIVQNTFFLWINSKNDYLVGIFGTLENIKKMAKF